MKKLVSIALLVFIILLGGCITSPSSTVWVNPTAGYAFHRHGCSYLNDNAISMSREQAVDGGYTPCHRCTP